MKEESLGFRRIRPSFNPSATTIVHDIKRDTAALIDLTAGIDDASEEISELSRREIARLKALACTAYEEAAMWAVKAATLNR